MEENIFVITVYMLSLKKKNLKCHTRDCFKNNGKQGSMPVSAETFGTTKQVN